MFSSPPPQASPLARMIRSLIWSCIALVLAGCHRTPEPAETPPAYGEEPAVGLPKTEYIFAVHPLHNPRKLFEVYQPFVDRINARTRDFAVTFESSQNYADFEHKMAIRRLHFALPNPYQTVRAESHGYRVFAKMGDDARFRGLILVRKDSGIKTAADLRGAPISFPAATAVAGCMMPKLFLMQQGLDAETEAEPRYVGSQESSIVNVAQGLTKAGCTWPPPWETFQKEHPEQAALLEVRWETEPLVNNSLMARGDVSEAHVRQFSEALLSLADDDAGRAILARMALTRYEPATSATYEPVRQFLAEYQKRFGRAPTPPGEL